MTRLKRLLSYTGIFVVTLCMAAGFVILQFLFSNKNSTPNLVVGAEDTTFSQVLNKVMESDNLSADFEISISVGGEDLCLYGLLEFDLAKILKAGDDIIDSLEMFVDFNIESDGEVVPVIIKIVDGMCYTTVANNQLKFKVVDTVQNIGTILALTGFEIPTSDLMANVDMSSLMGLMENISTDATEDGYQIIIPLFDMGEVEILADKKYNITEINLNELTFEGISVSAKLDIETDKEDFAIAVSTEEEKGLDVSNLMKFATALSNTVEGNKLAGNVFVKTKHFENSFDFGFDLNKTYGYILGNIAGKDLQVVTQNKNVYLAFNDFKFKASYEDITSVVTFVKDYVESFANISIEEEINNELNSIQQTGLTLSDVLEKLNIVSVDVKEILNGLTFENDGNTLVFDYAGLKFVATIVEDKIDVVEIAYNEYQISLNPTQNIKEIEIIDSEYVDYTFYQSILNRIVDFVESKKFSLTTSLVLGESEYKVYIKVDLNNGYAVELKTTIGEFNIKANLLNNILYLQVNEQKVSYALKSGENLTNILSDVFAQFDFSEYEDLATSEVENLTIKLNETLNQLSNITEEQVFEILSYFALNYVNNNQVDFSIDDFRVSLEIANEDLLSLELQYKDAKVSLNLKDNDWSFDLNKNEFVEIDNINAIISTIIDITNTKQVTLCGTATYKTLTLPVVVKVDFEEMYFELSTVVLGKEVLVVYTNENIYLTIDGLKVKVEKEDLSSLETLFSMPEFGGFENVSLVEILSTLKITNSNSDNITISYKDVLVSLNQSNGKLANISFAMPDVCFEGEISSTITKQAIIDSEFATVEEIKNIYNKVKTLVDAKTMNIVADVKYGDYEFNGSISLDLSDLNNPQFRIYNAYFNEYKIDITYIDNTLYAKINELKVYLAVDLDNIQDVLDKVGYAYNNFTNSNLDIPNIKSMIEDYRQIFNDLLNSTEDFTFEDFMDIYNKIVLNGVSNFKFDCEYENIKAVVELNGKNLINAYVGFDNTQATIAIDKKQTAIYVPDLTDYSNLTPVVDILGKVTDTFSTKKFGLSTTIEVMGEKILVVGYADLSDFESGIKVSATATIAGVPVFITYFEGVFYFEAKGLKMSATLSELQQLFEVDIKKFIETNLDETLMNVEEDIKAMLEDLDILDGITKVDNTLTLYSSMGLDLTFVENETKIESIVVNYEDFGLNATLSVLGFNGTITKPEGEFTVYSNGIKLATTFIDFATSETFNVAINGVAANQNLDFVFDIEQKDAYITSINAKGTLGSDTRLQIGYLGEEKYILLDGNKVYDYTEEQAKNNTVYTNPAYIFADYNGLKVKLDTVLLDKIVGFMTGLFNIDLSVVYDLLNLNIPSYDMEVMQGLVTGYDTKVEIPVDQNSGLKDTLDLLESINLSMDGTTLTINLTDGGKAIIKTEVVGGVTRLATLELVDIAMGEDKINLTIDFYCELPSDMADIPSRDDAAYMDLSTLGNFMEVVVNTANLKRFKLQGQITINLGEYKFTSIDAFIDIDLVKTLRDDGSYVWKPYIVVALRNLPDSNTTLSSIILESDVRSNNGNNHQATLYIVDNDIYIFRRIDKSKRVSTGFLKWETQYYSEVLEQKKMSLDSLSTTDGVVELMDSIVGMSSLLEGIVKSAFENTTAPSDYSPEKMFYNTYNSSSKTYTCSYTYDGQYHILLNGKYLAQNTSLGDMSADISTTTKSDGKVYLSKLDFTLNASSILINLENMTLVDSLSHSSYANINATLNNDIIQLEKGTAGFEAYFYGLSA